jgi:hypothetical protein
LLFGIDCSKKDFYKGDHSVSTSGLDIITVLWDINGGSKA